MKTANGSRKTGKGYERVIHKRGKKLRWPLNR